MRKIRYDRIALIVIVLFLVASAFFAYKNMSYNNNNLQQNNDNSVNYLEQNSFESVVINGKVYDKSVLEKEYNIIPDVLKAQVSFEDYIKNFFVPRTLLMLDAEKNNIVVSEDEINKALEDLNNTFKQQNTSVENYLKSINLTLEEFKNRLKQDLLVQKEIDFVTQNVSVSDDEIKTVYDSLNLSSKNISFEKAKGDLYNIILNDKKNKFLQSYLKQLEQKYGVEYK